MFITMKSLFGVVVEAPFLGTNGGVIMHGAGSPVVVPVAVPLTVSKIKSMDFVDPGNILAGVKGELEEPDNKKRIINLGGTSIADIIK